MIQGHKAPAGKYKPTFHFASTLLGLVCLVFFPVSCASENQIQAGNALGDLRTAFNTGNCQAIYGSSALSVRRVMTLRNWSVRCRMLQRELGTWDSVTGTSVSSLPHQHNVFLITGQAAFTNGEYAVDTYWQIEAGSAHWYFLSLTAPQSKICIPKCPGQRRNDNLQDPPSPVG